MWRLRPFDLLSRIEAARTASFCGFHRLTVDDGRRGLRRAATKRARSANQRFIEQVERAAVAQLIKVMLDGRDGRKVLRQHRPLAARPGDVLDGVPDIAQQDLARTPDARGRRHERFDDRPLCIRAIACISRPATDMVPVQAVRFSVDSQPTENHKPLKPLRRARKFFCGLSAVCQHVRRGFVSARFRRGNRSDAIRISSRLALSSTTS